MNRYIVLVLSLALPLDANAFQPFTRHIDGATITATRSATQACGVDLHITLTDQDQRMVIIDYSYSGTFEASTFSGPYTAGKNLEYLSRDTRSGVINASMGNLTYLGRSHLTYADPRGLYCLKEWTFTITAARTYNATQDQRNHQDELKRKEQARIDEINQRKAAQEEQKRKAIQMQIDMKLAKEKAEQDYLHDYVRTRGTAVNGSRCIINERADIQRCEESNARILEESRQLETKSLQAKREEEAKQIAAARQAAQFKESDELYERTRADPCAVAAEQARRMPQHQQQYQQQLAPLRPYPAGATAEQRIAIDRENAAIKQSNASRSLQNAQMQAQWQQGQSALEAMCASTKSQPQAIQQQPLLQQQEALRLQDEQQKRLLAQQKAWADLDAAIQQGKKTVGEAENNTQNLKNDNADLMNLINKIK